MCRTSIVPTANVKTDIPRFLICPLHTGHVAACQSSLQESSYVIASVVGSEWAQGKLHVFFPPCCAGLHIDFNSISEIPPGIGKLSKDRRAQVSLGNDKPPQGDFLLSYPWPEFKSGKDYVAIMCFLNCYQLKV